MKEGLSLCRYQGASRRTLATSSCHVLLTIAIVQIPHNDDGVGRKGHRQRMEDRFFSLATSRIGTGFLVRLTASRFATPPSVLRVLYAHGLLDVSECNLDFPPPSKLNQDRRSGLFVIGAEKARSLRVPDGSRVTTIRTFRAPATVYHRQICVLTRIVTSLP